MSFDEFYFRLKERIKAPFYSSKRFVRFSARLISFGLFAVAISTLAPTLADELAGSPEMIEPAPAVSPTAIPEPVASASASPTPESSASPTAEPEIIRPTIEVTAPAPLPEGSDSATVVEAPPAPLEVQPAYTLRIPRSVSVDPRAKSYLFPHIYAATGDSSHATMVCISGAVSFDTRNKQSSQNADEGSDLISGDRSNFLMISASTARVVNLINSWQGLLVFSPNSGIANQSITFQFVAVTKPVIDPAFCGAARSATSTVIRPLGLGQSTVKGTGTLK